MTKQIRYHKILNGSYTDGPGKRTVIFMQGCDLACTGCQNRHIWDATGGTLAKPGDLAEIVLNQAAVSQNTAKPNITISGGEPFQQDPAALAEFVHALVDLGAGHIMIYSGLIYDDLVTSGDPNILAILEMVDILVDGPFRYELDHDWLQWRGSANQRPIDLKATMRAGCTVLLDWEKQPRLILTDDGQIIGPKGLIDLLQSRLAGSASKPYKRCGQTTDTAIRLMV
jgi:anaerobic ribonucleoside-triphosphate reductase activating protein